MCGRKQLTFALRVGAEPVRRHVEQLFQELERRFDVESHFQGFRTNRVTLASDDETYRWFSNEVDQRPEHFVILVSDDLVEGEVLRDDTWTYHPKQFTKELLQQVQGHVATLALMRQPQRVTDIDRTIPTTCRADEFLRALTLCARKLDYMAAPVSRMDASQSRIHVRRIGNVTELLEYFKLRHDVYSIMGYLTPEIELCRSGMEINWNDRNAMHWGAFLEQPSGREVLVGTARLALTQLTPANSYWDTLRTFERWTEQLAVRDPVTRSALDQPLLLELPILHSVRDLVSPELIKGGACGELSRVIVAPECRGAGISSRLVRHAVSEAGKIGVGRLFLECLPIHVPLYERSGFEVLPKPAVRVISVKRTMVPMELARRDARSAANPPARCAIPPTPG